MAEIDFNKAMLPHNRKELFFDIIKNHYRTLIAIGLILLAFSTPLLAASFISDYHLANLAINYSNGKYDIETYKSLSISFSFYMDLIKIPALGLLGIGVASIMKIVKNLCYLEPVFFTYDFKNGLKNNWLSMSFLFLLVGFLNAMTMYVIKVIPYPILVGVIIALVFVIFYPPLMMMIPQISIYTNKFYKRIYLTFVMYVKFFFPFLGVFILAGLPFLLFLIPSILIKYLVYVVVCIFLIPISYILVFLYSSHIFDRCINQKFFPELVNKGIKGIGKH